MKTEEHGNSTPQAYGKLPVNGAPNLLTSEDQNSGAFDRGTKRNMSLDNAGGKTRKLDMTNLLPNNENDLTSTTPAVLDLFATRRAMLGANNTNRMTAGDQTDTPSASENKSAGAIANKAENRKLFIKFPIKCRIQLKGNKCHSSSKTSASSGGRAHQKFELAKRMQAFKAKYSIPRQRATSMSQRYGNTHYLTTENYPRAYSYRKRRMMNISHLFDCIQKIEKGYKLSDYSLVGGAAEKMEEETTEQPTGVPTEKITKKSTKKPISSVLANPTKLEQDPMDMNDTNTDDDVALARYRTFEMHMKKEIDDLIKSMEPNTK